MQDGGGCAIDGGIIQFVSMTVGEVLPPSQVVTDSAGLAQAEFKICGYEIPTPPDGVPMVEAVIRATLVGYLDVYGEISIICRRPQ